jgi:hypothetical protein
MPKMQTMDDTTKNKVRKKNKLAVRIPTTTTLHHMTNTNNHNNQMDNPTRMDTRHNTPNNPNQHFPNHQHNTTHARQTKKTPTQKMQQLIPH